MLSPIVQTKQFLEPRTRYTITRPTIKLQVPLDHQGCEGEKDGHGEVLMRLTDCNKGEVR